jgi:hypothetical protein
MPDTQGKYKIEAIIKRNNNGLSPNPPSGPLADLYDCGWIAIYGSPAITPNKHLPRTISSILGIYA